MTAMSIWSFDEHVRDISRFSMFFVMESRDCIFCGSRLHALHPDQIRRHGISPRLKPGTVKLGIIDELGIDICPRCGWWRIDWVFDDMTEHYKWCGTFGILREFPVGTSDIPTEALRQELLRNPRSRHTVSPRKLEDLVGAVFADFGYQSHVTGYARDGGIDVILRSSDEFIGVQVKRYKGKIAVSLIRELAGALWINGFTRGIFVTTSDYTFPSSQEAAKSGKVGMPIELMNWERFFDVMKVDRIAGYDLSSPSCPFRSARVERYSDGFVPQLAEYLTKRRELDIAR